MKWGNGLIGGFANKFIDLLYGDVVMSTLVKAESERHEDWRGQREAINYLSSLGELTHSITISLKPLYLSSHTWERYEYEKATAVFTRMLNSRFFGKKFNRRKKALPMITSFETKYGFENPHLHIAIGCPADVTHQEFENLIDKTRRKIRLFDQQLHIQPYLSSGWIGYLSKEGMDSLILSCCHCGK